MSKSLKTSYITQIFSSQKLAWEASFKKFYWKHNVLPAVLTDFKHLFLFKDLLTLKEQQESRWLHQADLGQVEVRIQELYPGPHLSCRGPSTWTIFICLHRPINNKLGQKLRSLGLIRPLILGIPALQVTF